MTIITAVWEMERINRDRFAVYTVLVDFKIAHYLLSLEWDNKSPIDRVKVSNYVDIMSLGLWKDGDPIVVSKQNILLDGRHRLQAAIEWNAPLFFHVTFGVIDRKKQNE